MLAFLRLKKLDKIYFYHLLLWEFCKIFSKAESRTVPPVPDTVFPSVPVARESGRRRKENVWDKGPLNGFLYCPDCGSKLYFNHPSRLKTSGTYMCGYYLHYKKCSTHYIRRDELDAAVLERLREDCTYAREHEADFVKMVEKKTRRNGENAVKEGKKEYAEAKSRIEEIDQIINQLYEDKVSGGLSAERFSKMLVTFETEQETLRSKCEKLQAQIAAARTTGHRTETAHICREGQRGQCKHLHRTGQTAHGNQGIDRRNHPGIC